MSNDAPKKGSLRLSRPAEADGYTAQEAALVDVRQLALELAGALDNVRRSRAGPTLDAFWPRFVELHARANRQKPRGIESKVKIYEKHLAERLGARPMGTITDADIQELKAGLSSFKPKTVNNVLSTLNRCLKFAVELGELDNVPVRIKFLRTADSAPPFYEFEEYARLISFAEQDDLRALVCILLGGDAGLRLSEKISLEWEDVDWRRGQFGQIHVQRAQSHGHLALPKGGKTRWVPMTEKLFEALSALKSSSPAGQTRVLVRDGGEPASEQVIRTWMSRVQRAAGFKTGRDHILRHTFCSHLAMRGAPEIAIKELAGHQSARTTWRYMHLAPSEKGRAIQLLDEARSNPAGLPRALEVKPVTLPGFETGRDLTASETSRKGRKRPARRARVSRQDAAPVDALSALRELLDEASGISPRAKEQPPCESTPPPSDVRRKP